MFSLNSTQKEKLLIMGQSNLVFYCIKNGFMEDDAEQFCTNGKSYQIQEVNPFNGYIIIDDNGEEHFFGMIAEGYDEWFELKVTTEGG